MRYMRGAVREKCVLAGHACTGACMHACVCACVFVSYVFMMSEMK